LSIVHLGRRYLHLASAAIADATGKIEIPIEPMLRIFPEDGDVVEIAKPIIEGFVSGDSTRWKLLRAPYHEIGFRIEEAE
ncbi:hypothetical protein PYV61_26230, partial [Roseisolibacter sp. H3M3-2]